MPTAIVIPSRWGSTRFPGKPLALIAGRTLIDRVVSRAQESREASAVWVATDDHRILEHVRSLGARAVLTGEARSGTDRIAMALTEIEATDGTTYNSVLNVQGDEPLIDIKSVDAMIRTLRQPAVDMVTLACPFESPEDLASPDVVKVVTDLEGDALYFSRSPIPWGDPALARRHVGLYGYRRDILFRLASLQETPLERSERLEQLRALQNNVKIRVLQTMAPHQGVDRPEDVVRIEDELRRTGSTEG